MQRLFNRLVNLIFLILVSTSCQPKTQSTLKKGFVYLHDVIPNVVYDIRYYSTNNFVGKRVNGYKKPVAILSKPAADALKKVQEELNQQNMGLKVFDAYRPQKAVDHFVSWGKNELDTLTKSIYYPDIDKSTVFELGYVATKSGHTRGSTIDLTIIDQTANEELDMGSPWDLFGEISHHDSPLVNEKQTQNRNLLRNVMVKHGFVPYASEWWHYTLKDEPYPNTYFNFNVE